MKQEQIATLIAHSQDGKQLNPKDEYSAFILTKIEYNTNHLDEVNVEDLTSDFNYMINQLKAAVRVLENI